MRRGRVIASTLCLVMLLIAGPGAVRAVAAPPSNDAFSAALELTGQSPSARVDTTEATSEPGELAAYPNLGATVWFRWAAPASGTTRVDVCDAGFESALGVFTGSSADALSTVAVDSGSCSPGSSVAFTAQAGETYRFAVGGWGGAGGPVTLRVNAPPPNDDFGAATALGELDGTLYRMGTTALATREQSEPDHASAGGGNSVWYRWTASRSGAVTIDTCSYFATFDTALAVYTGTSVGALTEVAANDDSAACLTGATASSVTFVAVAGTQYRIAVDGGGPTAMGDFQLALRGPPLNDDFAEARDLSEEGGWYGTLTGATKQAGEPQHAGDGGGHSVWFTWRAPRSRSVTVSACWTSFEPLLAVYTGSSVDALTPVGAAVDDPDCENGKRIAFAATADTTYRIALDGRGGAFGSYELLVPPVNDDFGGALALDDDNGYSANGDTARASSEPGEPAHLAGGGRSLWYTWQAAADQSVTIDTCESGAATVLGVYTGSALDALAPVASSASGAGFCPRGTPGAGVAFAAEAGTTYRIAVDAAGAPGPFDLTLATQPANDAFASPATLSSAPVYGSTRAATKEPGEPAHAGDSGGRSVWYRWTAPAGGPVNLQACGSYLYYGGTFDTVLAVYTGTAVNALNVVAESDGAGADCSLGGGGSAVSFVATAGTVYRIAVDGAGGTAGGFTLSFPPAPGNDAFASPGALSGSYASTQATTAGASRETGEPEHAGDPGGRSVWYAWTAPDSGRYVVDTCSSSFDTLLAVYSGTGLTSLQEAGASDDAAACGAGSRGSLVVFTASPGTAYRFAVDGKGGASGSAFLQVAPAAYNDAFASAGVLGSSTGATTKGAGREPGEPLHAANAGGASVWWTFTATDGGPVTISTCPSGGFTTFDTLLAIYTGTSLAQLAPVASSDDAESCGPGSKLSSVTFEATAGTEYKVAVDGKDGAVGSVSLDLVAKPYNDDFASAGTLYSEGVTYAGSTRAGGREPGEPAHAGDGQSPSVWYRWTAQASGPATFETCAGPSTTDTILAVYSGDSLATLSAIAANDDAAGCGPGGSQSRVSFPSVAGTEYRIAVAGKGAGGQFHLRSIAPPANDAFAAPRVLGPANPVFSGSNTLATNEPGEPDHGGTPGGRSLWFSWTPVEDALVTFDACNSSFDTMLAVYTGDALDALTPVAANDDHGECGSRSRLTFTARLGTTYRVAVDGKAGATGLVNLEVIPAPRNDGFDAAGELWEYGGDEWGTTRGATAEAGEPAHAGAAAGRSVWYRWVAPKAGDTTVSTCGTSPPLDTLLAVYTGSAVDALAPVAASDDAAGCGADGKGSRLTFRATAGRTYRVAVDSKGAVGWFKLTLTPPPRNDDLADATGIGFGSTVEASNQNATRQEGEPLHAEQPSGHSVWYGWTADRSGEVRLATCDGGIDTLLAVYTGTAYTDLTAVASNDDSARCGTGSALTFTAAAGRTYRIAVDGKGGAQGMFKLQFGRPENDDFAEAQNLTGREATVMARTGAAGAETGEPAHAGSVAYRSVWYRWSAPAAGRYTLSTCGSYADTRLAVYSGSSLDELTTVAVNDDAGAECPAYESSSVVTFTAGVGVEYRIALDGWSSAATLNLLGPPANDHFAEATNLGSALGVAQQERTTNASREPGEPAHAGLADGHSVWYRWTAPRSGETTIDTCSLATFSTALAVYTGTSVDSLTPLASGDGCGAERVLFTATQGTEYRIAVDGRAGAAGRFGLQFETPPPNDRFTAAATLVGNSVTATNAHASSEPGEPRHAGVAGGRSVWYRWTAPRSGATTIDTCSPITELDTAVAVYTGSAVSALTSVASNDDAPSCDDGRSRVEFTAVAGIQYQVAVDGRAGSSGRFALRVETAPPNDAFQNATALSAGDASKGSTTSHASAEPGEPRHAAEVGGRSVWYTWRAQVDGRVIVDTCGSVVDTLLAVYTGTRVSDLLEHASDDDGGACDTGASSLTFSARAGVTYRMAVDGKAGAQGDVNLRVTPIPANDDLADAVDLPPRPEEVTGDTRGASREPSEPAHGGPGARSIWYGWTTPVSATVTIDTCGTSFDTLLGVYRGDSIGELTQVATSDNGGTCANGQASSVTFAASAGIEYRIAVDGVGGASGTVNLRFLLPPLNDDYAQAVTVSEAAGIVRGNNVRATAEPGEQAHSPGGRSVWYGWTAPATRLVRLSTCGSTFDTVLSVLEGAELAGATRLADNNDSGRCGAASAVSFQAVAGREYRFLVDGAGGATGDVLLAVNQPSNDDREDAAALGDPPFAATATNLAATAQPGEAWHWSSPTGSLWWRWTAGESGPVTIDTCASDFDTVLSIYRQAPDGQLTQVAANDNISACSPGSRVVITTEAGTTYLIAVDGRTDTDRGRVSLRLDAPTNDMLEAATVLEGDLASAAGSTGGATREPGEPDHGGAAAGASVWFAWTAPADARPVFVDTCDATFASVLAVYIGGSISGLAPVSADAVPCAAGSGSRIWFSPTAGRTYRFAVDGADGARGDFAIRIAPAAPRNDHFADAELLTGPAPRTSVLTIGATSEPGEPAHAGSAAARSVWYRWVAPSSGRVEADLCDSGSDAGARLAIYTGGSVGSLVPVALDELPACGTASRVSFGATADTEYRFVLDSDAVGTLALQLNRPRNDAADQATEVPGEAGSVTGTTLGATDSDEGAGSGRDVWYRWTAPRDGRYAFATSCAGGMATALAVQALSDPARRSTASGCATLGAGGVTTSLEAEGGAVYLVSVASPAFTTGGTFVLRVNVPSNDLRANASQLVGISGEARGSTAAAGSEPGEPNHAGGPGGASIWYSWTAASAGTATVDTCGSAVDTLLAVYLPGRVAEGDALASNDDARDVCEAGTGGSAVSFETTAGGSYLIAVDARNGAAGAVSLKLAGVADTTPPDTGISGPAGPWNSSDGTFTLTATESRSTFECSLDGGAYEPCSAQVEYQQLAEGQHTVRARAIDRASNVDPTPAERSFVVDITAPDTRIVEAPSGVLERRWTQVTFESPDDGQATFQCSLDGRPYGGCRTPLNLRDLEDGDHQVAVRARDAAGNVDVSPASIAFAVDTALTDVAPSRVGPSESASILIRGRELNLLDSLTLSRDDRTVAGDLQAPSADGRAREARFDLAGAQTGKWDLAAVFADGRTRTIPGAITVVGTDEPVLSIEVTGRGAFRPGQPTDVTAVVTNSGSVDGMGVPVVLRGIPAGATVEPLFEIQEPVGNADSVSFRSLPFDQERDTVTNDGGLVVPLLLARAPAGRSVRMEYRVTAPRDADYAVTAEVGQCLSATAPGAQLAEAQAGGTAFAQTSRSDAAMNCFGSIAGLALDYATLGVPLKKCLPAAGSLAIEIATEANSGESILSLGNTFGWAVGAAAVDCATDIIPVTKVAKAVIEVFGLWVSTAQVIDDCLLTQGDSTLEQRSVTSIDPNDIYGPPGSGDKRHLRGDHPFEYQIAFENLPAATAPAQRVRITDALDTEVFDPSTVSFHGVRFGSTVYRLPEATPDIDHTIDLRPQQNLLVRVEAAVDGAGRIRWDLQALDPDTGEPPTDPFAGFLPPNTSPPAGEGMVTFSVDLRDLPSGTTVANDAAIVFDDNAPIETPTWANVIDRAPPRASVTAQNTAADVARVEWSGGDDDAGVKNFEVRVSKDGGPQTLWKIAPRPGTETFRPKELGTYRFQVTARDSAGNTTRSDPATVTLTEPSTDVTPDTPDEPSTPATGTGDNGNGGADPGPVPSEPRALAALRAALGQNIKKLTKYKLGPSTTAYGTPAVRAGRLNISARSRKAPVVGLVCDRCKVVAALSVRAKSRTFKLRKQTLELRDGQAGVLRLQLTKAQISIIRKDPAKLMLNLSITRPGSSKPTRYKATLRLGVVARSSS